MRFYHNRSAGPLKSEDVVNSTSERNNWVGSNYASKREQRQSVESEWLCWLQRNSFLYPSLQINFLSTSHIRSFHSFVWHGYKDSSQWDLPCCLALNVDGIDDDKQWKRRQAYAK